MKPIPSWQLPNAEICNLEGEVLFTSKFLLANRSNIIWLMPIDESFEKPQPGRLLMDQPPEPTRYSSLDPNMLKLRAYLISTVAREIEQVATTSSEREAMVNDKLKLVYAQTGLKLPESVRIQLFHDVLDELGRLRSDPIPVE